MRLISFAAAGVAGLLTLAEGPAMTPIPGTTPEAPLSRTLEGVLGTQNRRPDCARRYQDCTFMVCCDARYCRENGQGQKICR